MTTTTSEIRNSTIGNKIRSLRLEKELTQEELSAALAISRSAIAKYESNNGIPSKKNLKKIASYFHVSTNYLKSNCEKDKYSKKKKIVLFALLSSLLLLMISLVLINLHFYSPKKLENYYLLNRFNIQRIEVSYQNSNTTVLNDEMSLWKTEEIFNETYVTPRYFSKSKKDLFTLSIFTKNDVITMTDNSICINEIETHYFELRNKHLLCYFIESLINKSTH